MSKRNKALWVIAQHAVGSAGLAAVPTPFAKGHNHAVVISLNELALCVRIAEIYAERSVTKNEVTQWLIDFSLATVTGGGLAFVGTKVGHALATELLHLIPGVGWVIKASVAAGITVTVELGFLAACEKYFPRPGFNT